MNEMDELHSIANYKTYSTSSNYAWESALLNADMSHSLACTPPYISSLDSDVDVSTGYLQDALFEFNSSKRRRLMLFSDDSFPIEDCWKENCSCEDYPDNFDILSQINENHSNISGKSMNNSIETDQNMKAAEEEAISSAFEESLDSPTSSQTKYILNYNSNNSLHHKHAISPGNNNIDEKKKRKVVYPFAVVKPGGIEGDMTINDINERVLKTPTRPVRHPVGDFACRPISTAGPGLSGKAVVALTRIQTQGSGTITIIRTKG